MNINETASLAEQFGVAMEQVERDYLISHLWALSQQGAIDAEAARLHRRYGPTNKPPAPGDFTKLPTEADWQNQLAGQTRLTVSPKQALAAVRDAWAQAITAPITGK
jgi:hypothetical protein